MKKLILFLALLVGAEASFPLVYSPLLEQTNGTGMKTDNMQTTVQDSQYASTHDLTLLYRELKTEQHQQQH